jgi:hypothetical protein
VKSLEPQSAPTLEGPVFDGGWAVGVTGLKKGTVVKIVSIQRKGVIGQGVGNGDQRVDVPLWFPLAQSDVISLRTLRCGLNHNWGEMTVVQGPQDLNPPKIADPVCDCGGSVLVREVVPGSLVEVLQRSGGGMFMPVGSAWAGVGEVSVDVPVLKPADVLLARQRRAGMVSGNGPQGEVRRLVSWSVALDSAFRLCQLTQDWEPTPRPHPVNTSGIDLYGTDLGVPVEHNGRLYLFFGDCTGTLIIPPISTDIPLVPSEIPEFINTLIPVDVEPDADPIAYTTLTDPDELEVTAPDMHWITGSDGKFRRLAVDGLPDLGNFEVPAGAFSYDGRIYLFVTAQKHENPSRMTASFLAVGDDPQQNFKLLQVISSTVGETQPAPFPGGRWMLHISPTVVKNADWPGLPSGTGDGLLMFGSSIYHGDPPGHLTPEETMLGNAYLAWAPLTPGQAYPLSPIPPANQWRFLVGFAGSGGTLPIWDTLGGPTGRPPMPLLPPDPAFPGGSPRPRLFGELSVVFYPWLRRWVLAGTGPVVVNVARYPWGPWTTSDVICDPNRADRDAGNLAANGHWLDSGIVYAPYLIPRWWRWDRSTRIATLYYTLSVVDDREGKPQYQPQLMRSSIRC